MKLFLLLLCFYLTTLLTACHEPNNPLLGSWQHTKQNSSGVQEVVEFTPSTMISGGQRVTVVYQIRPEQVRVSVSKRAIIYDLVDQNTISYDDDDKQTVTLQRILTE